MIILTTVIVVSLFVYESRSSGPAHPDEVTQTSVVSSSDSLNSNAIRLGPIIPGLKQSAIPQGLAFDSQPGHILISHYSKQGPSFITITDNESGEFLAAIRLIENDGSDHVGHAGGIAVGCESLFVASDGEILQFPIVPFRETSAPETARLISRRECETNADFATATDDLLFIGEFAYANYFPTDKSHHCRDRSGNEKHAWVCGYPLNGNDEPFTQKPTCILSIPDCIQGMCVTADRIYLSESFGRRYRSRIFVYRNPLQQTAHRQMTIRDGTKVPLWFLDEENLIDTINLPPMTEGITIIGDQLAILTESAARKYRFLGTKPVDRIMLIDLPESND